ncbi:hypothetical protein MHM39_15050 [Phaeobacter sp. CNT1-3]|nr:hypothetical protein [Phaeobacter sp. CNT1-3]
MTVLLFDKAALPRTARVKRMHVADAGCGMIRFHCPHCGHDTGLIQDTHTVSENKPGLPCTECNEDAV